MKRHLPFILAAALASPLAMAVGSGPTYPDNPHSGMPEAGTESTRNPTQAPVPRDTDPRVQGRDSQTSPSTDPVDPRLPGMDGSGSEGTAGQGSGGQENGGTQR